MKRNNLLIIVVAVAAVFLLFNPLQYLRGKSSTSVQRPSLEKTTATSLLSFAESGWQSPEDYVVSTFASHDIVLLGEFYKIKQNVDLVGRLIPRLYAAGVRSLGIEFALAEDQKDIDAMLTAPTWDEAKARAITFDWLVTWGYSEYIDLYKDAWQVNHDRPAGAAPFRILGLNVRQNWEYLKTQADLSNPEVVAKIVGNGIPDAFMAQVIDRELIQKGQKGLIYVGTQHAFARYHSVDYEKNAQTMKLAETRRTGNIVFDRIGAKAFSISLHSPWPDRSQQGGLAFAAEGAIDNLIDLLPPDKKSGGWNTSGTPLGALPVVTSAYANGQKGVTLANVFDGYIVEGPIGEYTTVTPIPDFVQPKDYDRAITEFPAVKANAPTGPQINQFIIDDVQQLAKTLQQFR